jgi:hypothetical protein
MADGERITKRAIPVLVGHKFEHVMGRAEIVRKPDGKVLIEIEAAGEAGKVLADFLEQAEPIAVSFTAIPVQNIREKREKT